MSDTHKLHIKQLDDKSDYGFCKIREEATCSAKDSIEALTKLNKEMTVCGDHENTANGIMVPTLRDSALGVLSSLIGEQVGMLENLDARFDSQWAATKISKVSELFSVQYASVKQDIAKHINCMATLIEQLNSLNAIMDDALQMGIIIAYIDVTIHKNKIGVQLVLRVTGIKKRIKN